MKKRYIMHIDWKSSSWNPALCSCFLCLFYIHRSVLHICWFVQVGSFSSDGLSWLFRYYNVMGYLWVGASPFLASHTNCRTCLICDIQLCWLTTDIFNSNFTKEIGSAADTTIWYVHLVCHLSLPLARSLAKPSICPHVVFCWARSFSIFFRCCGV